MHKNLTDEELLAAIYRTKDNRLLGILLQRYTLLLLGVCMKYLKNEAEAKDCVQLVFMKAVTYLPNHTVTNFKSWIYTVAKNQCFMLLRSKKTAPETVLMPEFLENELEYSNDKEKEILLQTMENAIEDLPFGQKECIQMFYLKKMSYNDIVQKSEFTLLQVKSNIQNGKRNLKSLIEKRLKSF
ncbi:MAG: sigma-70 family RNA polymerase sigma factor [Pseudopedobacter saltans]|uniref:Sigma-70 family RNA polymerase sigma factor n=1 Tax=Pseudopedobacter saltans TaxID=151895 RepID=A0A2W5GCM0_9SPHI|nr:MAG: sigma-70 family RNA polymerase sigma factor [Pseudopedobacter saltans]